MGYLSALATVRKEERAQPDLNIFGNLANLIIPQKNTLFNDEGDLANGNKTSTKP